MTSEANVPAPTPERSRRPIRRYVAIALAVYWVSLFIATHVPLPALPVAAQGADKIAHLVGYAGLGVLLSLWAALGRRLTITSVLLILGGLAFYGAADEWLQQYVNRVTDIADWIADVTGAALGIAMIWLLQTIRPLADTRSNC